MTQQTKSENVERREAFKQVCVWPGTVVMPEQVAEFEAFFLADMGARVQFLETIETKPDLDRQGNPVPETGGRHDVFMAVHQEDIGHFAIPRLQMGIRWLEDAVSRVNGGNRLYPERVMQYLTWDADPVMPGGEDEDLDEENFPATDEPKGYVPGTTIQKPAVELLGGDGNAYLVIGKVKKALKRAKVPTEVVEQFQTEATSGDYDNVLATAMKYAEVV